MNANLVDSKWNDIKKWEDKKGYALQTAKKKKEKNCWLVLWTFSVEKSVKKFFIKFFLSFFFYFC